MAKDEPGLARHKMRDQTGAIVESFLLRPFQTSDPRVSLEGSLQKQEQAQLGRVRP